MLWGMYALFRPKTRHCTGIQARLASPPARCIGLSCLRPDSAVRPPLHHEHLRRPHAQYTPGQACGNGIGIALDVGGDGCAASQISVGVDPHDLRVDGQGNIFWSKTTPARGLHPQNLRRKSAHDRSTPAARSTPSPAPPATATSTATAASPTTAQPTAAHRYLPRLSKPHAVSASGTTATSSSPATTTTTTTKSPPPPSS